MIAVAVGSLADMATPITHARYSAEEDIDQSPPAIPTQRPQLNVKCEKVPRLSRLNMARTALPLFDVNQWAPLVRQKDDD
jgi:hypothetical protein